MTTMPTLDDDGVPDSVDSCVPTPEGQVVNAEGCAIAQICPCNGNVAEPCRLRRLRRADGERLPRGRPDQRCASWLRIVLEAGKSRCGARSGN